MTGVQTCALPIYTAFAPNVAFKVDSSFTYDNMMIFRTLNNSYYQAMSINVCPAARFNNLFFLDLDEDIGAWTSGAIDVTINKMLMIACTKGSTSQQGINVTEGSGCKIYNFESYACRGRIWDVNDGIANPPFSFYSPIFGVRFDDNASNELFLSGVSMDWCFFNPTYGSNITNAHEINLTFGEGKIRSQDISGTINDNVVNMFTGKIRSTGAGLPDTTVRTSSSLALRIEPRSGFAQKFIFQVPLRLGEAVSVLGYAMRNAQMTSDIGVALYFPGIVEAVSSVSLVAGTNWQLWSLSGNWTGASNRYGIVEFEVPYDQAGGYLYIDDIGNGNNILTALDLWEFGEPSSVMYNELGDPQAVWNVINSGFASNTMGELVDQTGRRVDDAGVLALAK